MHMAEEFKDRIKSGFFVFLYVISGLYLKIAWSIMTLIILLIILQETYLLLKNTDKKYLILYPVIPFVFLIINQLLENGNIINLFILITSFAFDIGAYVIGKQYGKHKIAPEISPQKSWEGLFGGLVLSVIIQKIFFFKTTNYGLENNIFSNPFILALAAFFGDLFESYLKRLAGVKDSGTLLKGHGGLLDRFDSVIFVTYLFILTNSI